MIDQTGFLVAPKSCEFIEDGKWIKLKVRSGELIYPRPDNLVTLGKTKFEKDENVCIAYNTTSPIYKLNGLINLMKAKPSLGTRYFEKETVLVSDCYALEDGTLHYTEDESGYIHVMIGSKEYQYNPLAMYYFPDGAQINKFDRICSGVVNMTHVVSELKNVNDVYLIFRKQMFTLTDPDFIKTNITSLSGTQEEIIELLFTGLTNVKYDAKTHAVEEIEYNGTGTSITGGQSFYTALSFGYGSKVVDRAIRGDVNLDGDVIIKSCPKVHKIKLKSIISMNYRKIYDNFIASRLNREVVEGKYYEEHHIIPKCAGGIDDKDNLILLTAREHLFAHIILTEVYPDNLKLKFALMAMCGFTNVGERRFDLKFLKVVSTKFIAKIREESNHAKRDSFYENGHGPNFGKIFSEEHRKHISEARLGKFTGEDNPFFGKNHTEETKAKLSDIALKRPKLMVIDSEGVVLTVSEAMKKYSALDCMVRYWANKSHKFGIYWYKNKEKVDPLNRY